MKLLNREQTIEFYNKEWEHSSYREDEMLFTIQAETEEDRKLLWTFDYKSGDDTKHTYIKWLESFFPDVTDFYAMDEWTFGIYRANGSIVPKQIDYIIIYFLNREHLEDKLLSKFISAFTERLLCLKDTKTGSWVTLSELGINFSGAPEKQQLSLFELELGDQQ